MSLLKKNPKLMLVLTGIAFLASGFDSIDNRLIPLGIVSFVVAGLNFSASLVVIKHPFKTKIALLSINAFFSGFSYFVYAQAGRSKIQYGWAAVCIIHLAVIAFTIYKQRRKVKTKTFTK